MIILAFLPEILGLGLILLLVGIALVAVGIAIYFGAEYPKVTAMVAGAVALCVLAAYWQKVEKLPARLVEKWRAFKWQALDRETRVFLIFYFVVTPLILAVTAVVFKILDSWH